MNEVSLQVAHQVVLVQAQRTPHNVRHSPPAYTESTTRDILGINMCSCCSPAVQYGRALHVSQLTTE